MPGESTNIANNNKKRKKKSTSPYSCPKVTKTGSLSLPASSLSTESQDCINNTTSTTPQVPFGKSVKPIFINSSIQNVKHILSSIKLAFSPVYKVKNSNSTQISCFDINDKKIIIDKLKSQQLGYHTYSEPADKSPSFILKGFYHTTTEEIHNHLFAAKLPVKKVSDFIRKDDYVFYLVQLNSSTININLLNHSHRIIDGVMIKWENFKKSSNRITQCFNCQRFGHSSANCGLPSRCVKCSLTHEKGKCSRVSREGNPVCCNCGGSHSANHRGCSFYKQHMDRLKSNRHRKAQASTNFQLLPSQFPSLVQKSQPNQSNCLNLNSCQEAGYHQAQQQAHQQSKSASYSEKLNEAIESDNIFKKFYNAQEKLKKIPNIQLVFERYYTMAEEMLNAKDLCDSFKICIKYSGMAWPKEAS